MSKIKILPIILVLIVLCACNSAKVKPVSDALKLTAHISYFNKEYTCETEIQKNGDMTLVLTQPQIMSGAKIVLTENEAYAEFQDIKYPIDINRAGGAPYFVLGALRDTKGKWAEKTDKEYVLTGEFAGEKYEITYAATGIPIKLTADNIMVEFMNVEIIK